MNKTIALTALVSDESAVVEVQTSSYSNIGNITATGWSKKHPNDKPDAEVGYNVAVARALRALADKFDQRAEKAMENPQVRLDLTGYVTGPMEFTYADNDPTKTTSYLLKNAQISTVGRY